jgi:hypothetical protein
MNQNQSSHSKPDVHSPRRSSTSFVGVTADRNPVYDRASSHIHDLPAQLLVDAISRVVHGSGNFTKTTVNFGRTIGQSICVETGASDEIVYARRVGRYGLTRFVFDRGPVDCDSVIVILKRMTPGSDDLVLVTSFIGSRSEPEPWDFNATTASAEFWSGHALIWGSEPIESGSEAYACRDYWFPLRRTSRWIRPRAVLT